VEAFDTLSFHSFTDYLDPAKLAAMESLRTEGLVARLGVSVYGNEELAQVVERGAVQVVQCPFNMLDNEGIRGDLLRRLKARGIEVHVRSVFLQGLFMMDPLALPPKLTGLAPALDRLRALVGEAGLSMEAAALNYALGKDYIDRVLVGVETLGQLEANLSVADRPLAPAFTQALDRLTVERPALLSPVNWS
jgi:aryl-alcohol dehydrogenase-like predicted oxidoreductase